MKFCIILILIKLLKLRHYVGSVCHDDCISVAFAFDTTGSMSDDLSNVKLITNKVLKKHMEIDHILQIKEFVLIEFNDPNVGPVRKAVNVTSFEEIINSISVNGGDDCPEMSLGGIELAVKAVVPESIIYVFTDASAKDYHIKDRVFNLIREKAVQVVFLLTGDCGNNSDPRYLVYNEIASVSSGKVFEIQKTNVDDIIKAVEKSFVYYLNQYNISGITDLNQTDFNALNYTTVMNTTAFNYTRVMNTTAFNYSKVMNTTVMTATLEKYTRNFTISIIVVLSTVSGITMAAGLYLIIKFILMKV